MESNGTISSNPDTADRVDIERVNITGPSSTCTSNCGSDCVADDPAGPTQEELMTSFSLRENVIMLQSSEHAKTVHNPTESARCNASVTLPENIDQASVTLPANNDQSPVDLPASVTVNNDQRTLNYATNTANGVDLERSSQKNDTLVQPDNNFDTMHSTLIHNAEGCKAVETLVSNTTMTDAEAVCNAMKLQATLVTDIDKNLTKMDCGQLADLPQYLQLKQLCQHLQVCFKLIRQVVASI